MADSQRRASVRLPYGSGSMSAPLPDGWAMDLVAPMGPGDLPDPADALAAVFDSPVDMLPLAQLLPPTGRIALILSAESGYDHPGQLLTMISDWLTRHKVDPEQVTVVVTGSGRPQLTVEELKELLGEQVLERHRCVQFDPDGPAREVGPGGHGLALEFGSLLWDFQLLIPLSRVYHHHLSGFSGGRDLLFPGLASRASLNSLWDLLCSRADERTGWRQGLGPGRLRHNPFHECMLEAARMLPGRIFLVAYIRGNQPGSYAGFWTGDLYRAHLAACRTYLGWKTHLFESPFDLVLSASGGEPWDSRLDLAAQGLLNAARLVKPGGRLIHLVRCEAGMGGPMPDELESSPGAGLCACLRAGGDPLAATWRSLRSLGGKLSISLVGELSCELVEQFGFQAAPDLQQALEHILPELPPGHATAVFPNADTLLPAQGVA